MSDDSDRLAKKEIMKDILLQLHRGLPTDAAQEMVKKEVGNITPTEITEVEQSLLDEGLSPEEIKKLYNVYALILESALEKSVDGKLFTSHPVRLFKSENQEINNLVNSIKDAVVKREEYELTSTRERLKALLRQLRGVEVHYDRKEQTLFSYLEKEGVSGPSRVMRGKDNEIRDMLKTALAHLEDVTSGDLFQRYAKETLIPLLKEIEGMIFLEDNILFPASLEKLSIDDWVQMLEESDVIGYVFIDKAKEMEAARRKLQVALLEEPVFGDNEVLLPSGALTLNELVSLLNTLPVDITFVDTEDVVRYFSEGKVRVFGRQRAVIGQTVQNCHISESMYVVERILASFKDGSRDSYDFWLNRQGRFLHIRYFAVRDKGGQYLGTLEVMQDITEIRKLKGEKRLLDEED